MPEPCPGCGEPRSAEADHSDTRCPKCGTQYRLTRARQPTQEISPGQLEGALSDCRKDEVAPGANVKGARRDTAVTSSEEAPRVVEEGGGLADASGDWEMEVWEDPELAPPATDEESTQGLAEPLGKENPAPQPEEGLAAETPHQEEPAEEVDIDVDVDIESDVEPEELEDPLLSDVEVREEDAQSFPVAAAAESMEFVEEEAFSQDVAAPPPLEQPPVVRTPMAAKLAIVVLGVAVLGLGGVLLFPQSEAGGLASLENMKAALERLQQQLVETNEMVNAERTQREEAQNNLKAQQETLHRLALEYRAITNQLQGNFREIGIDVPDARPVDSDLPPRKQLEAQLARLRTLQITLDDLVNSDDPQSPKGKARSKQKRSGRSWTVVPPVQ